MKKIKILIRKIVRNYRRYADGNLSPFAENVHRMVGDSKDLANPTPSLADLLAAITAYGEALSKARTRDRLAVGLKNTARDTLIALLDEMANFVTLVANNDVDIMLASGFDVNKTGGSKIVGTPVLVFTNGDNPGELVTKAKGGRNATAIFHEITPDPLTDSSVWRGITSTTKIHTWTGLPKGQNFWGRVTGIGSNQQRKVSVPASRIVQ